MVDLFFCFRVFKYFKFFEVLFFFIFLGLYYGVLVEWDFICIMFLEIFLYIWFVVFVLDELSEWIDVGFIFYVIDIWNVFDMVMIVIGVIFVGLCIVGLEIYNEEMVNFFFNVLVLEVFFMVLRVFFILSLSLYWGVS